MRPERFDTQAEIWLVSGWMRAVSRKRIAASERRSLRKSLKTLIRTGRLEHYEKFSAMTASRLQIFVLFELQGPGAKNKALYETLRTKKAPSQARARMREGKIAALAGFVARGLEGIRKAIEQQKQSSGRFRPGDASWHSAEETS